MKALTLALVAFCLPLSSHVRADESKLLGGKFSAWLDFSTDYVFRGESEVNDAEIPAFRGSFTWTHSSGFYAGLFHGSNKFESTPEIRSVLAPFIGKSGSLLDDSTLTYNVFLYWYTYPGASFSNYAEFWITLTKNFGGFSLGMEVTPTVSNWFGVDGWNGVNYAFTPSTSFDNGITLSATLGYQDLSGEGAEGWTHWNIGVSKAFYGVNFDLRYHNTDLDNTHKIYGGSTHIFDDRVVFGISKTF